MELGGNIYFLEEYDPKKIPSLLDWRPQSEAKMSYAFNEDHASIAESRAVLAQYNAILNMYDINHRIDYFEGEWNQSNHCSS